MRRRASSRILAAVLFTDIVDSSAVASRLGDARWKELIARHHAIVRRELKKFGGKELDTAGDGFYASFGEPAAAIRCACAASEAVRELGIEIRAGVHFGECERVGEKLGGIAVVVGARVMSVGGAGDVLVTSSTSELVAGAGFGFVDRGNHSLKGVDGQWHVLAVTEVDGEPRVLPAEQQVAEQRLAEVQPSALGSRRWLASHRLQVGVGLALVLALIALSIPLLRSGNDAVNVGPNSIGRMNAEGGGLDFAPTSLGQRPGASAIGFGSLWVVEPDQGVVVRVNLEDSSVIDPGIRVGNSPTGIAVGDGSVWVTNAGDRTVSRINVETNEVSDELGDVGSQPTGIAYGNGALWVTDAIGGELLRVDPATGKSKTVPLAGQPSGVAFTPDGVWVSIAPAGVARVDPADLNVTLTYQSVGNGPTALLPAFESIWVANRADGTVSRLEPSTGQQQATIPVGDGPNGLGIAAGSLWVANEFGGSITAIDPATNTADSAVPVGGAAVSLAADGESLWLAVGASAAEHRGGTLTVSSEVATPASLDPGVNYDSIGWQILSITNDGLLAYKKVGGPDGTTLVPDLASALPTVSADGLTYRFPLREEEIRYSTGDPVLPEDFQLALERSASLGFASLYSAIDGVEACGKDPSTCDLSGSIVTDAEAVTFHLVRPDPDLPFKLALPPSFPVPVGTPVKDQGLDPVPATGPYMILEAADEGLELIRNPAFHEWSGAAQPDGFVNAISWRFGVEPAAAFEQLSAGALDWLTGPPRPEDLASLQATHPDQVVLSPLPITYYIGMNVRKPPFNDKRVRQALNFAINRDHMVDLLGGPSGLHVTCQILPPNFQGYEPFCPYTLKPDTGVWSAPDLDRARALINDAHADESKVTVWGVRGPDPGGYTVHPIKATRYVVKVLNDLGLHAHLKYVLLKEYERGIHAHEPQAFLYGWGGDTPRASDFIISQFRCKAQANASGVCDENLDAAIEDAQLLEATEPAAANAAWVEIEHQLVKDAVWAPFLNPVSASAFSARTENIEVNPQWGILLSRLWVQ